MNFAQTSQSPASPAISVLMPVYNGVRYLAEAVESILTQTYQDFELILADDGSTDGSAALIHAFAARDARIRPLFLAHAGEGATLNAGLAVARGKWLALLKQDDIALPTRLATQLAWLEQNEIEIGGTCAQHIGTKRGVFWFPTAQETIQREFLFQIGMLDSSIMLPTAIARANPWPEDVVIVDYEWLTRLVLRYRVANLPAILVKYRAHPAQTHVVQHNRCASEMSHYQRRYFFDFFPAASQADYALFLRTSYQAPCTSLAQLAQSGEWLVSLLAAADRFQHELMGKRWLALCERSARLGPGCYQLYCHYAASFQYIPTIPRHALQVACTLRLRPYTPAYRLWRTFKHRAERLRIQ